MLRLVALILPVGLDTFAIAAAAGASGITGRARLRLSLLFALFEGGMPLIGFVVGAGAGAAIGHAPTTSQASCSSRSVPTWRGRVMSRASKKPPGGWQTHTGSRSLGWALVSACTSSRSAFRSGCCASRSSQRPSSSRLRTFIVTQVGIRVGARISERLREGAEQLAGVALVLLGLLLLAEQL